MRKYKNSPIVEALCEFRFTPSQPWDMTIPGLMYEKIKKQFPNKKQQMGWGVSFQPKEGRLEQKFEPTPPRLQFLNPSRTALVQLAPDLLTINRLKPYGSWGTFKPMILQNLRIYREIAKPRGFKRIGLRYINKIDFGTTSIELKDYFNYYPFIPSNLPQVHGAFNVRAEIPYENGRDRLLLTLASAIPEKPDIVSLILDLDYILVKSEDISLEQVSGWIENAHTNLERAFESCITDKCRELFERGK